MTGRFYAVLSVLSAVALLNMPFPAASALDADPALIATPDKKPFVMTVMGLRTAFPVAPDTIRIELGAANNLDTLGELETYGIVSEDDPEYAYEKFVQPVVVSYPANHRVAEVDVPKGFTPEAKAANITTFRRDTVDLKLHSPMEQGKHYAVIVYGTHTGVTSAGRVAYEFCFDPADIPNAPDVQHKPDLMTLSALGLRGLDSVGNGIIRLEFGPTFFHTAGYQIGHYHVTINGAPVAVKAMGRRSEIDLYRPVGWPYSVILRHEVFLQMDRVLSEGDRLRVEVDPAVVSGANAAEIVFSDKRSFSSAIKVNQIGYITSEVKTAKIGRWLGSFPDEAAVLAGSDETEHFRDISADDIFFGKTKKPQPTDLIATPDAAKEKPEKKPDAQEKKSESIKSGTASAADYEYAKSSLRFDVPPPFEIRDAATDAVVYSGASVLCNPGNRSEGKAQYSGENVYDIEFSEFKTPGRYYIAVPGVGRSFDFSIGSKVYEEAFQTAAYGVFAQRCGIALEEPYSEWHRIACHDHGLQVTSQRRIDTDNFIEVKKALFEKNTSSDVTTRPAIYSGPNLIAYFPFNGSAENAVPGGMKLSPVNGTAQTFKVLPNLLWDGDTNRVYETMSDRDNGWKGTLDYDTSKGLTIHFWLRRTNAPKGGQFDGDVVAIRGGKSTTLRMFCLWGVPNFQFGGQKMLSTSRFGDDMWHCWTFVMGRNSDGEDWTLNVYRDGNLIRTAFAPKTFSPGNNLTVGAITNVGAEGCYFDEFRVYNRVLGAEEVAKLSERVEAFVPKLIQASGGHHDAGDYNPRSHIDVAQVLMDAYEIAPNKFYDGQLNIPEKNNGIPDILDEALWALKLWIGLQDEDGGVYNGTESDGDPNFYQTVDRDPKGDYVFAKDSCGSFQFAGAMAHASRLLKSVGKKEMAADYLKRARRAYDWGLKNKPQTNDTKKFGQFYTFPLAYAAAQLFHTTGEEEYHQAFLDNTPWKKNAKAKMIADDGSYDLATAAYAYAAIPLNKADPMVHSDVVRAICSEANAYIKSSNLAAYKFVRHGYAPINWGTGAYEHFLTVVWHAWAFTDNKLKVQEYYDAMVLTADNTLGCNPLNLCWITGLGSHSIHAPLHNSRFNPTGFSVKGMQGQGPTIRGKEYNYSGTVFPKRADSPPLYSFVDSIFAIGMDEGTVNHQAETMAAFGLLLPDAKPAAKSKNK